MGIAFFQGKELIYHGVKVTKEHGSPNDKLVECRKIILRLIKDFKPNLLVVEKAFFANNRNAAILNVLVDEIKAIGKRKEIKVLSFAPSTVKKFICGSGKASKKELSQVIVASYPSLKVYLNQDRAWKEEYHQNMFDSVALGLMALAMVVGKHNPQEV